MFGISTMTKILLLSDTHSYLDDPIVKHANWADEIWHAGDIGSVEVTDKLKTIKPVRAVYGNIDNSEIRSEFPLDNRFEVAGVKVWMTHIGGYPKRYHSRIKKILQTDPPDLFVTGHSHILKVMHDKEFNLLHMNPGAAGKHGFHQIRTMLRFELDLGTIKNLEVIELGRR